MVLISVNYGKWSESYLLFVCFRKEGQPPATFLVLCNLKEVLHDMEHVQSN